MGDHLLVELGIDLDEIQRAERQFNVPRRQPERQRHALPVQRLHGVHAAGLQVDHEPMLLAEGRPGRAVRIAERLQVAHGQHHRLVTGDELDLRDVALAIERFDEGGQRLDLGADFRNHRQALAEVGDKTRILFTEADQGLVLLLDPAHREAALAAVTPARRPAAAARCPASHGRSAPVVHQHALLGDDLLGLVQMLQHAAGTGAEMGHFGVTRCGEACSTSSVRASSKWRLRAVCSAFTTSPGRAPLTKVTLPPSPSRRATPRPSWLRSRISVWNGVRSVRERDRATWQQAAGKNGGVLSQILTDGVRTACAGGRRA